MDILLSAHTALAVAGMVSIVCRLKTMSRDTHGKVRAQHALLFAGLLWSLVVPAKYAVIPVLAGVFLFLLLSADRWKKGPPSGTTKPAPLGPAEFGHVKGGITERKVE